MYIENTLGDSRTLYSIENDDKYYHFSCGCKFKVLGPPKREGDLPLLDVDVNNLPYCDATYKLLASGNTKGIFQLESKLGKTYSKALAPEEIEHLGALGSILRPGVLKAVDDKNVSMTSHYCHRKNKTEEITLYHPVVDQILSKSYGVLIYQETALELAQKLAGFTLQEADNLRRAAGKKLAAEMSKVKYQFIEGCKKQGIISEQQAEEVFGWIEKSQRYAFNKSISPNTMVELQNNEFVTIEELEIGSFIKAPSYESQIDEFVEVVDKYEHGEQELYEIVTESGKTIECTMEHIFICEDGKLRQLWEIISKNIKILCQDD